MHYFLFRLGWQREHTSKSVFIFEKFTHSFARAEMAALAALAAILGVLFFFRFRRFGKYLIAHKVASAIVLRHLKKS